MERFLFHCSKCDFKYSSYSEKPRKCPLCDTINKSYASEETDEYICFAEGDEVGKGE